MAEAACTLARARVEALAADRAAAAGAVGVTQAPLASEAAAMGAPVPAPPAHDFALEDYAELFYCLTGAPVGALSAGVAMVPTFAADPAHLSKLGFKGSSAVGAYSQKHPLGAKTGHLAHFVRLNGWQPTQEYGKDSDKGQGDATATTSAAGAFARPQASPFQGCFEDLPTMCAASSGDGKAAATARGKLDKSAHAASLVALLVGKTLQSPQHITMEALSGLLPAHHHSPLRRAADDGEPVPGILRSGPRGDSSLLGQPSQPVMPADPGMSGADLEPTIYSAVVEAEARRDLEALGWGECDYEGDIARASESGDAGVLCDAIDSLLNIEPRAVTEKSAAGAGAAGADEAARQALAQASSGSPGPAEAFLADMIAAVGGDGSAPELAALVRVHEQNIAAPRDATGNVPDTTSEPAAGGSDTERARHDMPQPEQSASPRDGSAPILADPSPMETGAESGVAKQKRAEGAVEHTTSWRRPTFWTPVEDAIVLAAVDVYQGVSAAHRALRPVLCEPRSCAAWGKRKNVLRRDINASTDDANPKISAVTPGFSAFDVIATAFAHAVHAADSESQPKFHIFGTDDSSATGLPLSETTAKNWTPIEDAILLAGVQVFANPAAAFDALAPYVRAHRSQRAWMRRYSRLERASAEHDEAKQPLLGTDCISPAAIDAPSAPLDTNNEGGDRAAAASLLEAKLQAAMAMADAHLPLRQSTPEPTVAAESHEESLGKEQARKRARAS